MATHFLSYLIWNGSPEILSIGSFPLRWYGLLFALGFLISQQILYHIYKKEGKPEKDVDTLTIYMLIATVLAARLGHVIFYQPELIWTNPLSIFLPFEFSPEFKFTGLQGLASHGAAFGILFALWLYSRKKKPGQNYMQVLDRIVIVVALTGALIRFGNFFNSEIIGKPTSAPTGVVFINKITDAIMKNEGRGTPIDFIEVKKNTVLPNGSNGRVPVQLFLFFKPGTTEERAKEFLNFEVKSYLFHYYEFVDEPAATPLDFFITKETNGNIAARVNTYGISRHPAQLYESISNLLLFIFLYWYWSKRKEKTPQGRIFGFFLVILWSLRFAYEFLKENQVGFEDNMTLNMGQILSIPLILVGIFVLIRSYRKPVMEGEGV